MLLVDSVGPFALVGFEGLDIASGLPHRAGHEPGDGVLLPDHLVHDQGQTKTSVARFVSGRL